MGSNSFHLVIASYESGRLVVVDRIREIVRLGGGLDENSNLTVDAQQRALECLRRFGQRLRGIPATNIRAVGTNTFRKARNIDKFLPRAQTALGHEIEIITGREEARLIYESVCYGHSDGVDNQLVVDIGGGSTEIIVGQNHDPHLVESLFIGCVSLTRSKFPNGDISYDHMAMAILDAQLEIRMVHKQFVEHGWNRVIGCSGTIRAISNAMQTLGLGNGSIERKHLHDLRDKIVKCKHVTKLVDLGFDPTRCEVLPGGFAVVYGLFELLNIDSMEVSELALREGVMYDLLGRLRNEDARERTVQSLMKQWAIDEYHAHRVRDIALTFYDQVEAHWFPDMPGARSLLNWATVLHEIGLSITHTKYHEHGAYLLEFSDLPGFSRLEQVALATLVRLHRRKINLETVRSTPYMSKKILIRLCILLRLAVLVHRPRTDRVDLSIQCKVSKKTIDIIFPSGWFEAHPLTRADIEQEKYFLETIDYQLNASS